MPARAVLSAQMVIMMVNTNVTDDAGHWCPEQKRGRVARGEGGAQQATVALAFQSGKGYAGGTH